MPIAATQKETMLMNSEEINLVPSGLADPRPLYLSRASSAYAT